MTDTTDFDAESVLSAIYDQRNERRVIWSPSTALSIMNNIRTCRKPTTAK